MEKRIDSILSEYPDVISQNQFYRICGISKRKAKWLLENGHVPCQISDKKTHRFKIKLQDVIVYLTEIKNDPRMHQPPVGMFNNKYKGKPTTEKIMQDRMQRINRASYTEYLKRLWDDQKDLLTVPEIKQMTGYCSTVIHRWIKVGEVNSMMIYGMHYIFKSAIVDQVVNLTITQPQRLSSQLKDLARAYWDEIKDE